METVIITKDKPDKKSYFIYEKLQQSKIMPTFIMSISVKVCEFICFLLKLLLIGDLLRDSTVKMSKPGGSSKQQNPKIKMEQRLQQSIKTSLEKKEQVASFENRLDELFQETKQMNNNINTYIFKLEMLKQQQKQLRLQFDRKKLKKVQIGLQLFKDMKLTRTEIQLTQEQLELLQSKLKNKNTYYKQLKIYLNTLIYKFEKMSQQLESFSNIYMDKQNKA